MAAEQDVEVEDDLARGMYMLDAISSLQGRFKCYR